MVGVGFRIVGVTVSGFQTIDVWQVLGWEALDYRR